MIAFALISVKGNTMSTCGFYRRRQGPCGLCLLWLCFVTDLVSPVRQLADYSSSSSRRLLTTSPVPPAAASAISASHPPTLLSSPVLGPLVTSSSASGSISSTTSVFSNGVSSPLKLALMTFSNSPAFASFSVMV